MRLVPAVFLSLLVLAGARIAAQTPAAAPDPKAFEPVGALSNGVQNQDAAMTASAYTEDAVVLPPSGETIRGKAAIEVFLEAAVLDRLQCRRWRIERSLHVRRSRV